MRALLRGCDERGYAAAKRIAPPTHTKGPELRMYPGRYGLLTAYFSRNSSCLLYTSGGNYHWIDNHIVRATRYTGKFTELVERQATIEVFGE